MRQSAGSLRKWTKQTNLYPNYPKGRENSQINKVVNEKGDIITDTEEIQRIIMSYFKIPYSSKLENLNEMEIFWIIITYQN